MGLFSKKEYVCEKCGKTFFKRINLNGNICDDCYNKDANERMDLENAVIGYVNYHSSIAHEDYSNEELKKIAEHREELLEKFMNNNGISRGNLQNASDNYKKLSDDEAREVLIRLANSTVNSTVGAGYTSKFFVPTGYKGMIVDAEDVFAVCMSSDYKLQADNSEVILCGVFTNDPYVPVFPMVFIGKTGFFEIMKSKKGREAVKETFEEMCPNLQYPVDDSKVLKKIIKGEEQIKGNIDKQFMLDQIFNVSVSAGIFDTKQMHSNLYQESQQMLDRIGYISEDEIDGILKMDKMFNRNFWNKQIKNMGK